MVLRMEKRKAKTSNALPIQTLTIGEVALEIFNGLSLSGRSIGAKDEGEVVIRVIFISDLDAQSGRVNADIPKIIRVASRSKVSRYLVQPNDVLISCRGTTNKVALFTDPAEPTAISANLIAVRPGARVLPLYLLAFFKSLQGQAELKALERGIAQQSFTVSDIASIQLPVPPLQVQQKIVDLIEAANEVYQLAHAAAQQRRDIALTVASKMMFSSQPKEDDDASTLP